MKPEDQLNEILMHLEDLQNSAADMQKNILDLAINYDSLHESTPENTEVHPELKSTFDTMKDVLSEKMMHTENMVNNALDQKRIADISNFMMVLQKAMEDSNDILD